MGASRRFDCSEEKAKALAQSRQGRDDIHWAEVAWEPATPEAPDVRRATKWVGCYQGDVVASMAWDTAAARWMTYAHRQFIGRHVSLATAKDKATAKVAEAVVAQEQQRMTAQEEVAVGQARVLAFTQKFAKRYQRI